MKELNFWDDYNFNYLKSLQNVSTTWYSPDDKATFSSLSKSQKDSTYDEKDFSYVRNSHGFRSDKFDNEDKIKILYSGCSLTEGIGLPLDHTWAGFLNSFISNDLGKPVKMYNLGYGGASIDAIIRFTYLTIENNIFTPDLVLMLLPSITRNEIIFNEHQRNDFSIYNFITHFSDYTDPQIRVMHNQLAKSFNPVQRLHETFRNLIFIKTFLDSKGIPFYFYTWDNTKISFSKDKFLGFTDILSHHAPQKLKEHIIPARMSFDSDPDRGVGFETPFKQTIGRDGMHPGPNSHWNYSKSFYKTLKEKNEFKKVFEKWKK